MTERSKLKLLLVLSLSVLAMTVSASPASARCHILCEYRHPITYWRVSHHVERCDWYCHLRRDSRKYDDKNHSSTRRRKHKGSYPCYITWVHNDVHYWRYHYAVGGSRNHVGFPPRSAHRCLPGQ